MAACGRSQEECLTSLAAASCMPGSEGVAGGTQRLASAPPPLRGSVSTVTAAALASSGAAA